MRPPGGQMTTGEAFLETKSSTSNSQIRGFRDPLSSGERLTGYRNTKLSGDSGDREFLSAETGRSQLLDGVKQEHSDFPEARARISTPFGGCDSSRSSSRILHFQAPGCEPRKNSRGQLKGTEPVAASQCRWYRIRSQAPEVGKSATKEGFAGRALELVGRRLRRFAV